MIADSGLKNQFDIINESNFSLIYEIEHRFGHLVSGIYSKYRDIFYLGMTSTNKLG